MTAETDLDDRRSEVASVLEPELPIIDPHHHLWMKHDTGYLIPQFQKDLAQGHNVTATVYIECGAMYRRTGPEALCSVGEAEFVAGMAAMSNSGHYGEAQICAGFVGAADLSLGAEVEDVIQALDIASGGRLRGVRVGAIWDADPNVNTGTRPFAPKGLLLDSRFRAGFQRLSEMNLVYDAWQYYPQLMDVCDLADAFPSSIIVVNHCGGLLGIGPYAQPDNFTRWKSFIVELSRRHNVLMKLGGLAPARCGFRYGDRLQPPTAEELAADWRPYIETCIEFFGDDRCMFESNFPVDRVAGSYSTIWNAFKLITKHYSQTEKANLYSQTAKRTYNV